MKARRVLVTGGAGFIGSHVADAYLQRGDQVWIVDDLSSGKRRNVSEHARFVQMNIADPALDDVFAEAGGFDIINHHAAQIDVRVSVADPRRDAATNIDGFLNVTECARRHGAGRLILISSGGVVYGEPDVIPTPETAPKGPVSPYGVSKLAAEYYLSYYHRVNGLDYVALRYSNVYGPRQDPHGEAGVVAIFSTRIMTGRSLTIFGDGEQTRDYVYVGDVVRANMLFSDIALPAATVIDERGFNIGTGIQTSVTALAETMGRAVNRSVEMVHEAPRPGELRNSALDCAKAGQAGWSAETKLEEGLAHTYRWIAEHAGVAS
jgi:UDP-glucose 4-epimerase